MTRDELARLLDHSVLKPEASEGDVLAGGDIAAVIKAVPGVPVKVIIEAGALTDDEKRLACRVLREAGAAFVKNAANLAALE